MLPAGNTGFVGKNFIELPSVDSTNEYAKALLSESSPEEGTVIAAREQTAGKGQFGKKWESAPGENLTFSVIFYPGFLEAARAHQLHYAVSLALHDFFFARLQLDTRIKWPNDIYHGDKKICGILIENALIKEHLSYSVIGIGINVNQTTFHPDIPNPVSLKQLLGKQFDLKPLLLEFFPFLEERYVQLRAGSAPQLEEQYQALLYHPLGGIKKE